MSVSANGAEILSTSNTAVNVLPAMSPGSYHVALISLDDQTATVSNGVPITVTVEVKCKVALSGAIVDAAPFPEANTGFIFKLENSTESRLRFQPPSWECIDPRFNWEPVAGRGVQWVTNAVAVPGDTRGAVNNATTQYFIAHPRGDGYDTHMQMRVSNADHLVSVGELGNVLRTSRERRGQPSPQFNTIRLYDMGSGLRDRVFDAFTLAGSGSGGVRRGLVNANSLDEDVLTTGFIGAPFEWPGGSNLLSTAEAIGVATKIIEEGIQRGSYSNLADICDFDWADIATLGIGRYTELQRESILAHSYGLFGTRQNLFTIIVAATPARDQMGLVADEQNITQTLGMRRALVQVWRDPVPNADGKHECFVRFFKWLLD